jgi:hypothetical protein
MGKIRWKLRVGYASHPVDFARFDFRHCDCIQSYFENIYMVGLRNFLTTRVVEGDPKDISGFQVPVVALSQILLLTKTTWNKLRKPSPHKPAYPSCQTNHGIHRIHHWLSPFCHPRSNTCRDSSTVPWIEGGGGMQARRIFQSEQYPQRL